MLRQEFSETHRKLPGLVFNIRSSDVIASQVQQAIRPQAVALTVFGAIAALAMLVLAGQGLAQMLSRTRPDISALRALGATRGDIFFQITVETAALALSGSILGVAVSWPASRLLSRSVALPFVFERGTAVLSFAAAVTIDLIFTFFPSRKAASVSPM